MSLHLVTGHAGHEHITPADHGAFYNALLLSGSYVLNSGNNFSATVVTSNKIKISDGELIMQGRHVRLKPGEYEEVTIENGAQESTRNDLIVARYVKDGTTGIENVSFVVIKGTSVASNPSDPAYIEGNILNGVLTADFPLYRVPLDGLNVGDLVPLFEVRDSFDARIEEIIKGTKRVGNAKTLDGHGADFFASLEDLANHIPNYYTGTTTEELDTIFNDLHANALPESVYEAIVYVNLSSYVIASGVHYVRGYRNKDGNYGWQKATIYAYDTPPKEYKRNMYNGTWKTWHLEDYLPKTGGTVTGDIILKPSGATGYGKIGKWASATADNGTIIRDEDFNGYSAIVRIRAGKGINGFLYELDSGIYNVLHTGNMADHVLPLTGGTVTSSGASPIKVNCTNSGANTVMQEFYKLGTLLGKLGISETKGAVYRTSGDVEYPLLHTGNSAKVVVDETAPSDTNALWVY